MKRSILLVSLRVSGYHDDQKEFLRLYTESRVSYGVAIEQFIIGKQMKKNGMTCNCFLCKNQLGDIKP